MQVRYCIYCAHLCIYVYMLSYSLLIIVCMYTYIGIVTVRVQPSSSGSCTVTAYGCTHYGIYVLYILLTSSVCTTHRICIHIHTSFTPSHQCHSSYTYRRMCRYQSPSFTFETKPPLWATVSGFSGIGPS